ncbi:MAG: hypothetical protein KDJ80_13405 [Nitratireductor sp.]|nr:hypothetical protein [Nitratireductor sp.]
MLARSNRKIATAPIAAAVLAVSLGAAQAARIDARQLTCQQARALVQQNGAVVMTFTNTTYDRVVKNRFFCRPGEVAEPKFTRTLDLPLCQVGGVCKLDPWKKF